MVTHILGDSGGWRNLIYGQCPLAHPTPDTLSSTRHDNRPGLHDAADRRPVRRQHTQLHLSKDTMLGFHSAKHVVQMGRDAFFPRENWDLPSNRSLPLQQDDLTPQFGSIGQEYGDAVGVILPHTGRQHGQL
jgi:hypothetical protein